MKLSFKIKILVFYYVIKKGFMKKKNSRKSDSAGNMYFTKDSRYTNEQLAIKTTFFMNTIGARTEIRLDRERGRERDIVC